MDQKSVPASAALPTLFHALLHASSSEERDALVHNFDKSLAVKQPESRTTEEHDKAFASILTATGELALVVAGVMEPV